ncbi:MAG: acetate kinase [Verrucomicrobia bacterium]|nr:MAG: acetate kinase [Verrucomicrobiota bacterium]
MKVLVANLGSTSFKFRLISIDGAEERLLAQGGFERVADHGDAIDQCLAVLREGGLIGSLDDLDAVGFKAVHGGDVSGCLLADDRVLEALERYSDIAPAHNPAYAAGIRQFGARAPALPLVALFETAFFQWTSEASRRYAVPDSWHQAGIRRYGFHGASHKFVAERSAELLGRDDVARSTRQLYLDGPAEPAGPPVRVISCHLGGSSSIAGIRNGVAIGCSLGFSPQSGLPHNNRVGDLDSAAVPYAVRHLGISIEQAEEQLAREGGLLGLSGVGNDLRDIRKAARQGDARSRLALDVLIQQIRHWIGAFLAELNGCDALVFTGGIGENHPWLREEVCRNLESLGVRLNVSRNTEDFEVETDLSDEGSAARIYVIPANEELVVARETARLVSSMNN